MDPVSHLLLARMVAALRESPQLPRGVVAATVLGGMAPDIDAGLMALGWDVYLRWHDAGTHSLVGTVPVALLTAAVVRPWAGTASLRALAFGAWLGVLSHVCFDLYSGATVRLLWPLHHGPWTAPVVAMADPIAVAVMIVAAFVLWVWPRQPRAAAVTALVLLALVSGVKLVTRARATAAYTAAAGGPATTLAVEAAWGSWHQWLFFERRGDGRLRAWVADGWQQTARLRFEQPASHDLPSAQTSRDQFATIRNFVPGHPFAFATARPADGTRSAVVFWSDVRFCWSAGEQPDAQEGAPHQDVRPAVGAVRCALWFGGSYGADGQPQEALVWLGGHLQRRAPQRW